MGVGDDHVHEAMRREGIFPAEPLVDPRRLAVGQQAEVVGGSDIAQVRAGQGLAGVVTKWGVGCASMGLGYGGFSR